MPEQVVDFLFSALDRDELYILCRDKDGDRALDAKAFKNWLKP